MKRLVFLAALTLALIGGYLYSQDFRPIIFAIVKNSIADLAASTQRDPGEFSILFCGTGSPNRTPDRGQPCTALIANGKLFLFDAGEGAIGKLAGARAPTGVLEAIFLTHLHSDHISGVAEVLHNTWLYGRRAPVRVAGPTGTGDIIKHFNSAYQLDLTERQRVLGVENIDPELAFPVAEDIRIPYQGVKEPQLQVVYADGDLTIGAFLVDHPDWPQAFGYRIQYRDKVVVISGDTRPSDGVRYFAKGADLLIHEALNSEVFEYIGEQLEQQGAPMTQERIALITHAHTKTDELAQIAEETGVKNLVITHLIPAMPATWIADQFFVDGMADHYAGNISIARDGQWLDINGL